jgi:hypothetical protein
LRLAFWSAALLAGGSGLASSAAAQPQEDERIEAVRLMYSFATCAVRRHRYEAEQFIGLEPDSPESRAMGQRMIGGDCLETRDMSDGDNEVSLRFSWRLFRGGVFEALYRRDFRSEAQAGFDAVPALVMPESSDKLHAGTRAWNLVRLGFGECVVRSAPAESRALILSEAAGAPEAAAFDALMPHFADCTAPGAQSSYSRPALRGIVAEALYRLSVGARGPRR